MNTQTHTEAAAAGQPYGLQLLHTLHQLQHSGHRLSFVPKRVLFRFRPTVIAEGQQGERRSFSVGGPINRAEAEAVLVALRELLETAQPDPQLHALLGGAVPSLVLACGDTEAVCELRGRCETAMQRFTPAHNTELWHKLAGWKSVADEQVQRQSEAEFKRTWLITTYKLDCLHQEGVPQR